jgi:hypothetical protein
MRSDLTTEELAYLRSLSTDAPVKPDVPAAVARHFIDEGLAIALVEGGLQLTSLGRECLEQDDGQTRG